MKRLFQNHFKRSVIPLSGAWKFLIDAECCGEEKGWQNGLPLGDTVIVPSAWNNELGLLNFEGCGWYERKFFTQGGTLSFEFESVMTLATVWLDGKKIGEHYGAFTQFELIVNDVTCGEHTLIVRADNRFDKNSFPQRHTDWFNYGGIARDVYAHELKGISILKNHIAYELDQNLTKATVNSLLELYNANAETITSPVCVKVGDTVIYNESVTVEGYSKLSLETPAVALENIKIWDTDAPNLYTVVTTTDTDDYVDKIGFRRIEVKDRDILLNNRSIELLGVNRHDEHPDWGFAFPAKLMKKDLDLICDMGCNTIRGSHYPNSQIFLDMLDERGILFWSEIPMWGCGFSWEALQNPVIIERGLNMHKEMTRYYYNHPSIIIWGMHNEIDTSQKFTLPLTEQYYKHLKEFGGNRLVTHASNHPYNDVCMGYNDIICINYYYGWYNYGDSTGKLTDWDMFVEKFRERAKEMGWDNKPVIMSEFGAAALAGFHSPFDSVRWSEEYQRELLEHCLELFHKTDYMRGTYIWQFCNIRTSPSMDINRARYFNNKGILDEYRNPKASYFKVKELYRRYSNK
ncbi:MAG: beta-glucuronidase [Clostridia bacterium]|nr:beta-glucuronidase [Clostridia bacterium]